MKGDLIVFDKDGTLIDFDAFWVNISVHAIGDVLKKLGFEAPMDEILQSFGVKNGVTDIDGILCKGTYQQMGNALYETLKKHGCNLSADEVTALMIQAYNENANMGEVKPTCKDIRFVLERLKKSGCRLAVVTTDNSEITRKCLNDLGIIDLFDSIFTDDGKTPVKPDPTCIKEYCRLNFLNPEDVIVVGDTMTDIKFARGIGATSVCVGSNEDNRQKLAPYADYVINDISEIFTVFKEALN